MDHEYNLSYITLTGHVEVEKYRYVYFLIMLITYILIICCNSTIVCLIFLHKNLHEPMYMFIAALLWNSILFSTTIYPKLLIDFLSEIQVITYSACLFQFFLFYSLGASEFLLLAAMSYDRYASICKPLQYTTIMTQTTVTVVLVLSWLLPACLILVLVILSADMKLCEFTLKGIFCNNSVYQLTCVNSKVRSIFGAVTFSNIVVFPILFIIFTYSKIFIISFQSGSEVRKKAAQTCLPHLLVLVSFTCLCIFDVSIARLESELPKLARLIMTLQVVSYHPLFNPIIYGLKMTEISKHLKRLFCPSRMG
ncbi:olfactory receptor 6N2-like [Sphaeramia orbicularis]|uniref:Olfactory receptor n=1 Tax=Sphaeramia orbicularis TaxID=375764 RepID=A0A673BE84_9TELE|nr:olfactory receptor 6N2-like [Sphaeramia orbicularis]